MNEQGEVLSPESRQIQLISVYKSLPSRAAAGGRMSQSIGGQSIVTLPQEQGEYLGEIAVRAGIKYSNSAELPVIKKELLERLLNTANITKASKDYIKEAFQTTFTFGVDETWTIFRIIGLTDESRMEAGIFSSDPATRKKIERDIYQEQKLTIESLKKDYPDGSEKEEIDFNQAILEQIAEQFQELYGEPI